MREEMIGVTGPEDLPPLGERELNLLDYAWLLCCRETLDMCALRTGLARDTLLRYGKVLRERAAEPGADPLWVRAAAQADRNAAWEREYTRPVNWRRTA